MNALTRTRRSAPGRRVARIGLATVLAAAVALPLTALPADAGVRGGRLAIGDSVMLGAKEELGREGFRVNATVSRQFYEGDNLLRSYGSSVPRNVVIHLGTNGTVTTTECKRIVKVAGKQRKVFFVNNRVPRSWQNSNNAALASCVRAVGSKRAVLIDWYRYSSGKSSWFYRDGYHLTPTGQQAYADLVNAMVDRYGR